ncbi:hypothetical protein LOTGIDRAFT_235194 [Lottia gigantea]|uniref:Cyclic nucleotide-binding domain-containing protein n=1 Tax=Lottia gigantea TaxID=225164 RepID=V4A0J8_LOTGI|nr:hypothetical protein LOTGIDRAFT_235194 [Lottia gigantea]ESO86786.1 hypothetical protein LOTGIDRAFT_235194 [Lottia gigantea]
MVLLKSVGQTVTAMVRMDKKNRNNNRSRQHKPLHPTSNIQKDLESRFIVSELMRKPGFKHGSPVEKSSKENRRRGSTSKLDLLKSLGSSDASENFRKLRRRNFPGSLHLTKQDFLLEYVEDELPLEKFQKAVRKIITMLKVVGFISILVFAFRERRKETDRNMLSWTTICDDLHLTRTRYNDLGLTFDPTDFKVKKKDHINSETIETLCLHPGERTPDQIRHCLVSLNTSVPAFSEFPKKMQTALLQVGWYERFEAGRVIIRQGHRADRFYLILSGQAVVTILETRPKKKSKQESRASHDGLPKIHESGSDRKQEQYYVRTARLLEKGKSFGELALLQGSIRTATVTCRTDMELLALDRPDFINIFMKADTGKEPDHIQFLKSLDILKGWPVDKIPWNDPNICAFTYVRRETILCQDSNNSDLIFVVMSGTCRVLKSLPAVQPKLYRSEVTDYGLQTPRTNRTENIKVRSPTSARDSHSPTSLRPGRKPLRSRLEADIALSRNNTVLSSVVSKTPEQVAADAVEHINIINNVYNKRHVLPPIDKHSRQNTTVSSFAQQTWSTTADDSPDEQIYIHLTKLGRGDVFGLEQVVLKGLGETTSSCLVSDGAECIMINKLFFRKHLTQDLAKQMRKKIQPFPSEDILQQKLQTQIDWEEFKHLTVLDHLDFNKHVQTVSWKH